MASPPPSLKAAWRVPFLRNILLLILLSAALVPFYGRFVSHPQYEQMLLRITEDEAARVTRHLSQIMHEEGTDIAQNRLPAGLAAHVQEIKSDFNLVKVKVFSPEGIVLHSTAAADVGDTNEHAYFKEVVARGQIHSLVVRKNIRTAEGQVMTADVVETYQPIMVDGRFLGAFELYYDVTERLRQMDRLLYATLAQTLGMVLLLGCAMLLLLLRAARTVGERDQAQLALRTSEARLRAIVANEPECVKIVDPEGRLVEMNPAGLKMVEADAAEQVVGRPIVDLIAPEYRAAYARMHTQVVAGQPQGLEYELNGLKGGRTWVETRAVPMQLDGMTMHLAITRDIAARKRNETALHQTKEAAEAANVAKSRFLATMSHEIRTPMNGILGMAQMLLMPNLSEQERLEYARIVLTSGQSLLALLNDILDLSKIEAGRVELKPSAFEPEHLLAESATLFAEPIAARGVHFEFAWQGPAGRRYRADPLRLRQMIANLLSNAAKFTEQGSIVLTGTEIESAAGRASLEFSVADTGCGIPPDKLSRLFQAFSQVDDSPTRAHGGTGLGLSIIARLARLMGGEAGVDSTPGQGSRFWFRIRADVLADGSETRQRERRPTVMADRNLRVLLVEDNPTNRLVVEAMLTKNGIGVDAVENGERALAAITGGARPALVLMDCQMPVMDGYEATRRIRALESDKDWPRLPIVALTAGAFADEKEACFAAGMDDFLAKPVDIRNLLAMIDQWTKQ